MFLVSRTVSQGAPLTLINLCCGQTDPTAPLSHPHSERALSRAEGPFLSQPVYYRQGLLWFGPMNSG